PIAPRPSRRSTRKPATTVPLRSSTGIATFTTWTPQTGSSSSRRDQLHVRTFVLDEDLGAVLGGSHRVRTRRSRTRSFAKEFAPGGRYRGRGLDHAHRRSPRARRRRPR